MQRRREIAELLPYARYLATRFGMAAGPYEDVQRVARQGLADAVDGFDPGSGITLLAHAAAVIRDQVRRDLRNAARSMRPGQRIDEVADGLPMAVRTLSRRLNRSPTTNEVALLLGACPEDVVDAIEVADHRSRRPPDRPVSTRADSGPRPAAAKAGIEHLAAPDRLRPLLAQLGSRDKQILLMRFLREMGTTQISEESGISPTQVDRLVWVFLARLGGSATGPPVDQAHSAGSARQPRRIAPGATHGPLW